MKKIMLVVLSIGSLYAASSGNLHRYMWANYKQFEGHTKEAEAWYDRIFSTDQPSIFTNKGYLHFLQDHGNYQRIVELMPKIEETFKNDPDIQLIFINAMKKRGNTAQAEDKLIRLSREFKTHPEVVYQATEAFIQRKEMNNALSLIDDYLNSAPRRPNNFIFYFLKGQVFMQMRDFKQAHAQIEQCLEAHPRFPQGWLLLAMIEEQQGKINDAIKGYTSYLEVAGPNKQIEQHLLGLTLKQKAAQGNRQILFVKQSCFAKALILFERKQYQVALNQVNQCLTQNQQDVQARLLKVQILSAMQNINELITTISPWIAQEPDNAMWYQTLHLLTRANVPIARVIDALTAIQKQHQNKLLPLLYLADLHTRAGSIEQAMHHHQSAKNIIQDPHLKSRILYQLAVLHYERNEYDQMLANLDQLDALSIAYAPADNLRSYYYATAGNDLDKAQRFFDKAYSQDRGNPHFLDTQAVILYKQHKYEKAIALLKPLVQKMAHDSSVRIHLAKAYNKLEKMDEARAAIDQAQQYAQTEYEKKKSAMLAYQWNKK